MLIILSTILLLFVIRICTKRQVLCFWIFLALFLVSALKDSSVGADLDVYHISYDRLAYVSVQDLWRQFLNGERSDIAFYLLAKLMSLMHISPEVWMGSIALIFAVCVTVAFNKESTDPFLSVFILFTLYFGFTMSALRQTVAMGLILVSYRYIRERRLRSYLLFIIVATAFHASALIFLPAYWIAKWRVNVKQLLLVLIALAICVFFPNIIRYLILEIAWNDNIREYAQRTAALNWSGYIIQLFMLGYCYFFRQTVIDKEYLKQIDPYINLMIVGLCLQGAVPIIAEAFRASYYYSMTCMFAVPNVTAGQNTKSYRAAFFVVSFCLLAYIIYSGSYNNFCFYWQK